MQEGSSPCYHVYLPGDLKAKYGSAKSHAERTQHEGKLNAPVNHMIDVASHWACACQRSLTSGTEGFLSC